MCQFYSDSSRFFLQPTVPLAIAVDLYLPGGCAAPPQLTILGYSGISVAAHQTGSIEQH
jgi:hypothetical protein